MHSASIVYQNVLTAVSRPNFKWLNAEMSGIDLLYYFGDFNCFSGGGSQRYYDSYNELGLPRSFKGSGHSGSYDHHGWVF